MVLVCTSEVYNVREGIMFRPTLSKFVNFYLCKKSLVDYKLIALELQINFKNGSGKFFHKP